MRRGANVSAAQALVNNLSQSAGDTAWYNAGTALLAAGDPASARRALERAARSLDPELRYRALYNIGVAALRQAAADSTGRDSLLATAAERLQQALALAPSSARAKWNLELAQRRRPPPQGGGSQPRQPPPGGQQPEDPQSGQTRSGTPPNLSESQAEQILNSVSREELETRNRRMSRNRSPTAERDW